MAMNPYVLDATRDNFRPLVYANSEKGLVLVHYWTPKAGPCMVLMPRLVKLAGEYGGRFLLVMANTDELGRITREEGVTSVPTIKFYLHGEVVHTIHGAEPDSTFRTALDRYVARPDDRLHMQALQAHQAGRTDEAIQLLAQAAVERPGDLGIAVDLAKLLSLAGQPAQALDLLTALPRDSRSDERVAPLLTHLQLLHAAAQDPAAAEAALQQNPEDHHAQLILAAHDLVEDRIEDALERLLHLTVQAPQYLDGIGRRGMLTLFSMLGAEHALTRQYRARLAGR